MGRMGARMPTAPVAAGLGPRRARVRAMCVPSGRASAVQILAGPLDPSPVMDSTVPLTDVPAGYAAMDQRRAIMVLVGAADT